MFSTGLQTVREAVNEYITQRSHQRRIEVAYVAELQRREQQNRDFIEYSYMENQGMTPGMNDTRTKITMVTHRMLNTSEKKETEEKNGGRNDDLLNLPDEIEEVLKDFGEDLIGLGHDELKPWIDVDLENSKFYKNLGETEDERSKHLEELREQQKDWRPHLFKCLQMALRDVRSYSFKSGKWIPSDHQSKRATLDEYASEVARKK